MRNTPRMPLLVLVLLTGTACLAQATPSSTVWTPMTVDIQGYGVLHPGVDNYFTLFREADDGAGDFPTDFGLTLGVLPFEKVKMEVGIDLLEPSDNPIYFNAKIGIPEGVLFEGGPTVQLGVFNVGTETDVTNYNIVYGVIGKSFANVGRFSAGPYIGNGDLLVDPEGDEENTGFMVAFDRGFMPVTDASGASYSRFVVAADYASGKNALGAGGVGLYTYFTPNVALLMGPVFFNEEAINGEWKWTIQLDINQTIFGQ